jgi:undecaprenyldiphospho-muramoylpentapeptide beta-N-acetylglucosaminyltransferase
MSQKRLRILISGGGTGGHVYPILAVIEALKQQIANCEFLYVGSRGGVEEGLVSREGLLFTAISTGALRGLAPWDVARNLSRMIAGFGQSLRVVRHFSPDAALVTGGYVCAPVAVAAWLFRVPLLVVLPDLEPGLAIRVLSHLATRVSVSFPEVARYFAKHKVLVAGYPVRADFFAVKRAEARKVFGLEEGLKTVTVFGGSRGAHSINLALSQCVERLLEVCQVIHICGHIDAEWVMENRDRLPERLRNRYHVYAYLHEEMPSALAAADLAVARAGAATLGEFPALGLPSILVPYPFAGQHQDLNAAYLVHRGAAISIADAELKDKLLPTILSLLENEKALVSMGERARSLARPDAARRIAEELVQLGRVDATKGLSVSP